MNGARLHQVIRSERGGGGGIYFVTIIILVADDNAQPVIDPSKGTGSITSATRLYHNFHDLLMPTTVAITQGD